MKKQELKAEDLDLLEFKLQIQTAIAELRELEVAVEREKKYIKFSTWETIKMKTRGIARLYKKRVAGEAS